MTDIADDSPCTLRLCVEFRCFYGIPVPSAIFKTSQYEVSSAQPLISSQFTNVTLRDPVPLAI